LFARNDEPCSEIREEPDAGEKDKNGVSVTRNGDFGVVDSAVAKSGLSVNLTIENAIPISHITIVGVNLGTTSSNGSG